MQNKIIWLLLIACGFQLQAQDKQEFKKEHLIQNKDTLNYRILYPPHFSKDSIYPVVLFLHGAGERGNDNETQLVHGSDLFLKTENRENYPAIVIFPQAPKEDYWAQVDVDRFSYPLDFKFHQGGEPTKSLGLTMKLIDSIASEKFVDTSRIYVGGLSMGGMGTFEIISRKPEMFAAAIAICGAADTTISEKYRDNFFIWVFHGLKDDVVNPEYSKEMVAAINKNGGNANLTLYKDANHNSWDAAFSEPYLLDWLFSHKKDDQLELSLENK
ncbi:prolyl oligopeptidase family serine peptidase [Gramella sp. AN32]|uniref:Prolyl oligopeptidase family serine peptidase n=1 Tax=Christiangramia antarctica TaxID=2058158 RepID=A0ABW5X543_9FLAO|nr:prolyl oligopeptidase family serine peptidase [Gramella sp. AN32]MCM4157213.1 phospholipase [Gramella sp. AN32]